MAEKKSPASGWPIVQGDFHTGDAQSCVAVVTMGSHLDEQGICDAGAAIAGSCKTENLGLEKVIANVISNPNIRFILCCGTEVKGHLSGQSFIALHAGGVSGGKIVGAQGAIPFIENLTDDAIKRFQEQVEIVNIMESEDMGAIKAKMDELKAKDLLFGNLVAAHVCGVCHRDVDGKVLGELLEVLVAGDEVGFAVELHHRGDLAVVVQVHAYEAFAGLAVRFLGCLRDAAFAQKRPGTFHGR